SPVENRVGETFDLAFVRVGVFPQGPPILPVFLREAFHDTRLVEPRKKHLPCHAAMFAVDLKSLFKVTSNGDRQIEVSQASIRKADVDEPAKGAESLEPPRADRQYLAAEEAGAVDEMAAVRQQKIAAFVLLGVFDGAAGLRARAGNRLQIVGHRV